MISTSTSMYGICKRVSLFPQALGRGLVHQPNQTEVRYVETARRKLSALKSADPVGVCEGLLRWSRPSVVSTSSYPSSSQSSPRPLRRPPFVFLGPPQARHPIESKIEQRRSGIEGKPLPFDPFPTRRGVPGGSRVRIPSPVCGFYRGALCRCAGGGICSFYRGALCKCEGGALLLRQDAWHLLHKGPL